MKPVNRQLYTYKFNSDKLKACNWEIETTFEEAHMLGEVVALADSEILRAMRKIRKRTIDRDKVERLYKERDLLRKRCEKKGHSPWMAERLSEIKQKIYRTMFVPDYITVHIERNSHYDYLKGNGFLVNGVRFKRLSCGPGQARVSTVTFCAEDILPELKRRVDNGHDPNLKIAASKYNAYFALAGTATFRMPEPRFCVVPDYHTTVRFKANYDTETDWDTDDEMAEREIEMDMCRNDGMGFISPEMAKIWADTLGLNYVPSEFIVRQSFLKGVLCVFPFVEFCEEVNGGNYLIDTIYKNENGEPIQADLRDCDVIITESQLKIWNGWKSQQEYIDDYHKNDLHWGVAQYSPKEPKSVFFMNY